RFTRTLLTALLCLLPAAALHAASLPLETSGADLPGNLGRIVYQQYPDSPCQLYIVTNSHRSYATGANGPQTVQAQIETFRIGEWLLKKRHLDCLLPEGFFGLGNDGALPLRKTKRLASRILKQRLADTSRFVNAELLLHRHYGIGLYQVEDRVLYTRARILLLSGLTGAAALSPDFDGDLAYLQDRRLAAILQNIPAALADVSRQEQISAPKAMLTIGLAHLPELVRYLETGDISIAAAPGGNNLFPPFHARLALDRQDVGVTIIIPRSLLSDSKLAQLAASTP
ncbi:MAG TPA: hypothetical protein VJ955_08570, partial [Desulfuromonadales bacterium]|nr:hypothetical protein [Desulfuromonadales bacterium]